jgi:hypothetical protein
MRQLRVEKNISERKDENINNILLYEERKAKGGSNSTNEIIQPIIEHKSSAVIDVM